MFPSPRLNGQQPRSKKILLIWPSSYVSKAILLFVVKRKRNLKNAILLYIFVEQGTSLDLVVHLILDSQHCPKFPLNVPQLFFGPVEAYCPDFNWGTSSAKIGSRFRRPFCNVDVVDVAVDIKYPAVPRWKANIRGRDASAFTSCRPTLSLAFPEITLLHNIKYIFH